MTTKRKPLVMDFTDDYDHSQNDSVAAIGLVITDVPAYEAECFETLKVAFKATKFSQSVELLDVWDVPVRMKYLHLVSAFQKAQASIQHLAAELEVARRLLQLADIALETKIKNHQKSNVK